MEKTYKFCQSCGMPMKKDEKGGAVPIPMVQQARCIAAIATRMVNLPYPITP